LIVFGYKNKVIYTQDSLSVLTICDKIKLKILLVQTRLLVVFRKPFIITVIYKIRVSSDVFIKWVNNLLNCYKKNQDF